MAEEGDAPLETPTKNRGGVRRDEGEVHQWPRGLVEYVPSGSPDAGPPPEEEERTAQRIRLAGRLIDLLHAHGQDDPDWLRQLREAERAYRRGERAEAGRRVDALLGELGSRADALSPAEGAPRQP